MAKAAGVSRDGVTEGAIDAAKEVAKESGKEPGKEVFRLEFSSVDEASTQGPVEPDAVAKLKVEVSVLEARLEEQSRTAHRQMDEARLLARLLARKEWEDELERRTQEDRAMVLHACEEFDRERTRYFAAVEGQVVKLALAIAGRVLHREAKMEPLLLSAAVRVALEKVKDDSEIRLRVPVSELGAWRTAFGTGSNEHPEEGTNRGPGLVQVVGDAEMARGECAIETSVGTVEVGIEAQLQEIEQGFFDLLKKRPA
jgi:flagellar assembly protein FliH